MNNKTLVTYQESSQNLGIYIWRLRELFRNVFLGVDGLLTAGLRTFIWRWNGLLLRMDLVSVWYGIWYSRWLIHLHTGRVRWNHELLWLDWITVRNIIRSSSEHSRNLHSKKYCVCQYLWTISRMINNYRVIPPVISVLLDIQYNNVTL